MKVITTRKIDGHDVIIDVRSAGGLIDPVATQRVVSGLLPDTEVCKKIESIKAQMSVYAKQMIQAQRNAKQAKNDNEKRAFVDEYRTREINFKEEMKKLEPLAAELKELNREMILKHAVYFTPATGDIIVDDEAGEAAKQAMIDATTAGGVADKDLKIIPDNRGKVYWKSVSGKWTRAVVDKLGDVPANGSILETDLTEEQRAEVQEQVEADRIAALKDADKAAEKASILESLANAAGQLKNKLEVLGDKDALTKAQDWLVEQTQIVNVKYA